MPKKVVVIGAGFGGLSAAAYLARDGYDVTVLEKNSMPGGRAMVHKTKGFTFDLGPSWYMMPDVFDDFFAHFGKKTKDYYQLEQLRPSYRIYTKDAMYDMNSSKDGANELFESLEPGSSVRLQKLLKKTKKEYEMVREKLLELDYSNPVDLISRQSVTMVSNPKLLQSYHKRIAQYVKNEDLQKILEFMVVFMGGSPDNIPALYTLLAHVDLGLGIWYPKGGFGAVVQGFEKLGKELGATYQYNKEVTKIESHQGNVVAVWVGKERIACDAVVANADYHFVETQLLESNYQAYSQKYWDKKTLSPSGLMIYLGVDKKVEGLLHHTMFFDSDWHKHFGQVFEQHQWSDAPLFYVGTPSKTDSTVAPKGNENIFILAPMTNGYKPTKAQQEALAKSLVQRMEQKMGTKFAKNIRVQEIRSAEYFEQTFNAYKGNAFGLAHTLTQSAFFRPRLSSKKLKNLFYAGQYTNPGTGVPMVVISGKIAARLVNEKFN